MNPTFQLLPEQASTTARSVYHLSLYLVTVAIIFSTLIFLLILIVGFIWIWGKGALEWI